MEDKVKQLKGFEFWDKSLTSNFVLSKSFLTNSLNVKANNKSLLIIAFMSLRIMYYSRLIFVREDAEIDMMAQWGSHFHALGFSGRMIYVACVCVCCQGCFARLLFWVMQKQDNLQFVFQDLAQCKLLSKRTKKEFSNRIESWSRICHVLGLLVACAVDLLTVILAWIMYSRQPSLHNAFYWTVHSFLQCVNSHLIVWDSLTLSCFWFVCRTHVSTAIHSISKRLDSLSKKQRSVSGTGRKLFRLQCRFLAMHEIISNFNKFSSYYVCILQTTGTAINAAVLFAALQSENLFIQLLFIYILLSYTLRDVTLLSGAATITSIGSKVYTRLSSLIVRTDLGFKEKTLVADLMEGTGSDRYPLISLMTLSGNVLDFTSLAAYALTYASLLIMMYGFLRDVM